MIAALVISFPLATLAAVPGLSEADSRLIREGNVARILAEVRR